MAPAGFNRWLAHAGPRKAGALGCRVPPVGWTPPPALANNAMITQRHVPVSLGIPREQVYKVVHDRRGTGGVPLAWGVYKTVQSVGKFFQ